MSRFEPVFRVIPPFRSPGLTAALPAPGEPGSYFRDKCHFGNFLLIPVKNNPFVKTNGSRIITSVVVLAKIKVDRASFDPLIELPPQPRFQPSSDGRYQEQNSGGVGDKARHDQKDAAE